MEVHDESRGRRGKASTRRHPTAASSFFRLVSLSGLALLAAGPVQKLPAQQPAPPGAVVLVAAAGGVEVLRAGATRWDAADTNQVHKELYVGDQLRTSRDGHATVRLADQTLSRLGPQSHLRMLQPLPREASLLEVVKGWFFFLHRDRPGRVGVRTPTVTAAIEGTEFSLQVAEADGTTRLDLFEGKVTMSNAAGQLALGSGQAGVSRPGVAPQPTAMLEAVNVIQWNLYYPAVLNVDELDLAEAQRQALGDSIAAYRRGDLLAAFAQYPPDHEPASDAEKIYLAALLLGVGHVEQADARLNSLTAPSEFAEALRTLIAAVKFQPQPATRPTHLATSLLAESYYQQSRSRLEAARDLARKAVTTAPQFAFALARLAELEFSFGRLAPAEELLQRSLALAPQNAQAVALQGFVLAARNQTGPALVTFDRAIALDPGLANAWLGRGLCRIRRGRVAEGLEDLLVAAATEPQRAVLRSYLGKAFTGEGDSGLARHELERARDLDPNDPTAWFYSALLNQLDNRINRAIGDLERSQELNGNRGVFRSGQLLDQDRAVRGINLANVYDDAGLTDVAFRDAARAVQDDYANFSTHLFLANSLNRLRDPRQVNLRYETPWLSEYLMAHLLAPVGAGTLSQLVSTEEYSRLFERNQLGLVSVTEYLSNGDWLQAASQYGRVGNWNYAQDVYYQSQNGFRPNGDFEALTLSFQSKLQLSPEDDVYFQAIHYESDGGDVAPRYSQTSVNRGLRFEENQEPILIGGYHHAWAPGSHTLLLAARLADTFSFMNPAQPILDFSLENGQVDFGLRYKQPVDYESELEIYVAEVQHFIDWGDHRSIVGARYQTGQFETANFLPEVFPNPPTSDRFQTDFERVSFYGYHHWQPVAPLRLIAGLSYDRVSFPENFRSPPISGGQETEDQLSPKAGLIWSPLTNTTVRAAYTRSLGGVSLDQSFQLEPAQVAGFVQTFRSLIPESVIGAVSAPSHQTFGLALDQKFPTRTYLGISGERLESEATRQVGVFEIPPVPLVVSTTPERLEFREHTLLVTLHQLLGEEWALGLVYRWSHAALEDSFTKVPDAAGSDTFVPREEVEAALHQVHLLAAWNSPGGLFARFGAVFSAQRNGGYSGTRPGDKFWQWNVEAGYRFPRRRAELSVGLLNLTDRDYRLNPLNLTAELPRERTVALRLRFAF